ncbi:tetratricopeptide repeat protein [bacterium]|nr:tetratricopeptide repeat protein [bacterium]
MAKKIDRHELKQDKFAADIAKIYRYASDNPTKILIWVIVVVVAVVAVIGYLSYSSSAKKDAQLKLSLVYNFMDTGNYKEAMDSLRAIISSYPKSPQAKIAQYLMGHMYYAFGQLDSAMSAYHDYLVMENPDSDLAAASLMGMAACFEEKSQYDRAIDFYYKVVKDYPSYFRADEAFASMARCYDVKGDVKKAEELYKQFLKKYPKSPLKNRVIIMLARIESKVNLPQATSVQKQGEG